MAPGDVLTAASAHAELAAALPGISRGAVADLMLLEAGARDLIRLSCAASRAPAIAGALERRGLAVSTWRRALQPAVRSAADDYIMSSEPTDDFAAPHARAMLFVARDPSLSELGESFATNDGILGGLLGYPPCCVLAYARHREHHAARLEPAFARGSSEPMPYWTNTLLDVFGWHLSSHFPCSSGCEPTRLQAARSWSALAAADAGYAVELLVRLRSVVVSHPDLGLTYGKPERASGEAFTVRLLEASSPWQRVLGGSSTLALDHGASPAGAVEIFDFTGGSDEP